MEKTNDGRDYLPRVGSVGKACLVACTLAGGTITAQNAKKRLEGMGEPAYDGSIHKALNNPNIFETVEEGPPRIYSSTEYGSLVLGEAVSSMNPGLASRIKRAFLANIQNQVGDS